MLIQILIHQPQMLGTIVKNTPTWVWGLLAALLALGISQLAGRRMSLPRVAIMPVAMLGLSIYGIFSAFGNSGLLGTVLLAWLTAAIAVASALLRFSSTSSARFDPASRTINVPGSVVPLLTILGIFMVKYLVGIELALAPFQAHDMAFALPVALVYGVFNGLFAARALRLLRLALPFVRPALAA